MMDRIYKIDQDKIDIIYPLYLFLFHSVNPVYSFSKIQDAHNRTFSFRMPT